MGFKTVNGMEPYASELIEIDDDSIFNRYVFQNRKRYGTLRKKKFVESVKEIKTNVFQNRKRYGTLRKSAESWLNFKTLQRFKTVNGMEPYASRMGIAPSAVSYTLFQNRKRYGTLRKPPEATVA